VEKYRGGWRNECFEEYAEHSLTHDDVMPGRIQEVQDVGRKNRRAGGSSAVQAGNGNVQVNSFGDADLPERRVRRRNRR